MKTLLQKDSFWAIIFLFPSIIGILVFNFIPTVVSFYLSFTKWNLLGSPKFVGLSNYSSIIADPLFYKVLQQTLIFVMGTVFFEVIISLFIALGLNHISNFKTLFRTIYFLPVVSSMVAVSILWNWIFDPAFGFLNYMLKIVGIDPIFWLSDPTWALPSIILVSVWKNLGYSTVLFLSGLQTLPDECLEAAKVDGAKPYQVFYKVILPLLSPTIFLVTIMSFINAFQTFDSVYILTSGGPQNKTNLMVYWLYKNAFEFYNMGRASAIAYFLFLIILTITLFQWNFRKRWVHYES
ncbi:MAG: sugar ABC transporter permease [Candidatus Sericytochromatia bacterium]|nr:sugar ABC transporter permease [Candidatus Sericytochromatia bacterium]